MKAGGQSPFEFGVPGAYCRVRYSADMALLTIHMTQSENAMQLLMDTPMCRALLERYWTTDLAGRYTRLATYFDSAAEDPASLENAVKAYYDGFEPLLTEDCQREDDEVSYSFTLRLTIENGAGEMENRDMTGKITFDTAQSRVSKLTFDKQILPFEELAERAYDRYKKTVDTLFQRLSNTRQTEPETTVITGLQGLPWAKFDDDTVNGDSEKPGKRLLHVDTDSDRFDAYVAVYYAPGVMQQGFGGVFRQDPGAENGAPVSASTAYAPGLIVQTFAVAKDGAAISEATLPPTKRNS